MNFFESQDAARRNTRRLVLLFLASIISLIAITNILIIVTLGLVSDLEGRSLLEQIDPMMFLWVSLAVLGVVIFGSLFKMASLSGGGARVAEMMQARLIVDGSGDPAKQRVLNVVEEMAIASGTPVPPVYLMEEDSINAFAAGYSQSDAVIGVTRGAIEKLSRDELQGVIAHEFSHILNGDMRLNIRLIGILHGIMVLGLMGYYLMRTAAVSRRSRNGGQVVILGLGLIVIGYVGTLFGNMIKSAVSRQREYLADASAVQYTRNPDGIAGALKRIGADTRGSVLENPGASEISHALFGNGVKSSFGSLFATHPPLKDRIKRIQPDWDGRFDTVTPVSAAAAAQSGEGDEASSTANASDRRQATMMATLGVLAESAMGHAGNPGAAHLQYARQLHEQLPEVFLKAAHDAYAARGLVYLLLLSDNADIAERQLDYIRENADDGVFDELKYLLGHRDELELEYRLPLVNIALSGMRQMSDEQYELFRKNLHVVLEVDPGRGLKQWLILKIVIHPLDEVFRDRSMLHRQRKLTLAQTAAACSQLLSWLAHAGDEEGTGAEDAFAAAEAELFDRSEQSRLRLLPRSSLSLQALDEAMNDLARLRPLIKPRLLKACAACIAADGSASVVERELFRAVAEIIDCPMPPLLDEEVREAGQS